MNDTHVWRAAAGLALAAAVAFGWRLSLGASAKAADATASERLARAETRISQLHRQLEQTQGMVLAARAQAVAASISRTPAGDGRQVEEARPAVQSDVEQIGAAPAPIEMTMQEMAVTVNARFESQREDPSWSVAARARAHRQIGEALPAGSKVVSLECRASLCRGEISHATLESHELFTHAAFRPPMEAWEGEGMLVVDEEAAPEKAISRVFLTRKGHALVEDTAAGTL